jgi:hypothetical protein
VEDHLDPSRRDCLTAATTERDDLSRDFDRLLGESVKMRDELSALRDELSPVPMPSFVPDWTKEDQSGLIDFLRSHAGRSLLARGRFIQHDMLVGFPNSRIDPNPQAARTWCECLDWLESLSRASARSTEATEPDTAQSPENHDTSRPGETALRERMSP